MATSIIVNRLDWSPLEVVVSDTFDGMMERLFIAMGLRYQKNLNKGLREDPSKDVVWRKALNISERGLIG
jgi:hypothetical protein